MAVKGLEQLSTSWFIWPFVWSVGLLLFVSELEELGAVEPEEDVFEFVWDFRLPTMAPATIIIVTAVARVISRLTGTFLLGCA